MANEMVGLVFGEMVNALKALDTDEERERVVRALHICTFGSTAAKAPTVAKAPQTRPARDLRRKYPHPGLTTLAAQAGVAIRTMRLALTEGKPSKSGARRRALRYLKGLGLR